MPPSKNQRSSAPTVSSGPMQLVGDVQLITPLNNGKHAYIMNPVTRRTLHLSTSSEAFTEAITTLTEAGHGERVLRQLDELAVRYPGQGWPETLDRLLNSGALVRAEL